MPLLPRFLRLFVVLNVFFTLASFNYTRAATFIIPPGNVQLLVQAIIDANNELLYPGIDTIELQGSIYLLDQHLPTITSQIIINGNNAVIESLPDYTLWWHFVVGETGDLTLNNINSIGRGCGVYVRIGKLAATGSTFSNCPAGTLVAIRNEAGTVVLANSALIGNSTGAILTYGGDISISNTSIMQGNWFAIENWGSTIQIKDNSVISDNHGAALYMKTGNVTITDSTIARNISNDSYGGAIYAQNATLVIERSAFVDNSTGHPPGNLTGGGAILNDHSELTIRDTSFNNNSADGGGAIYISCLSCLTLIERSVFSGNSGVVSGGAIQFQSYGALEITDSVFLNNFAPHGGGLVAAAGITNITNTIFKNNNANNVGGAISVNFTPDGDQGVTVRNSCFTGNSATSVYTWYSPHVLNVINNWWGSSDGPSGIVLSGHGDSISENVDFSPFLTSPPLGCDTIWQAENMPPIANEDNVVTGEDTAVTFNVLSNDTDVDNNLNPASATATSNPLNGVLTDNGSGNFSYTPNPNFNGTAGFTYQVCDSLNACASATVSIQVNPVNDAPLLTVDCSTVSVNEGDTAVCSGSVSDVDGGSLSLMASAGVIQPTVINGNGNWNWTFDAQDGPTNSQMISVSVSDSQSISSGTFNLVVNNIAPQISNLTGSTLDPVTVNSQFCLTGTFDDPSLVDVYSAQWNWGDNQTSTQAIGAGTGPFTVANCRVYTVPGVYTVALNITDDDNGSDSEQYQYVVVYDPTGGFVTGSGIIQSPAGAFVANPALTGNAHFGFVSKYQNGANVPTGNTRFRFQVADLDFRSVAYEWLVVAGARAQFKGTGTINGQGNYGFMLTAIDGQINGGGGVDRFRIKIWDITTGSIVYDNQHGSADNGPVNTVITAGNITVHK